MEMQFDNRRTTWSMGITKTDRDVFYEKIKRLTFAAVSNIVSPQFRISSTLTGYLYKVSKWFTCWFPVILWCQNITNIRTDHIHIYNGEGNWLNCFNALKSYHMLTHFNTSPQQISWFIMNRTPGADLRWEYQQLRGFVYDLFTYYKSGLLR